MKRSLYEPKEKILIGYWLVVINLILGFCAAFFVIEFEDAQLVNQNFLSLFLLNSFVASLYSNIMLMKIGKFGRSSVYVGIFAALFVIPPIAYIGMLVLLKKEVYEAGLVV